MSASSIKDTARKQSSKISDPLSKLHCRLRRYRKGVLITGIPALVSIFNIGSDHENAKWAPFIVLLIFLIPFFIFTILRDNCEKKIKKMES